MNKNTNTDNSIKHTGYVSKVANNRIIISLDGNISCTTCNAKAACGVADSDVKIVEIHDNNQNLTLNERVDVVIQNSLGLKAVFWGYVFPFILLFSVLMITSFFVKEWIAGLLALFVLIPYYLLLYLNKKTLRKVFTVSVIKK